MFFAVLAVCHNSTRPQLWKNIEQSATLCDRQVNIIYVIGLNRKGQQNEGIYGAVHCALTLHKEGTPEPVQGMANRNGGAPLTTNSGRADERGWLIEREGVALPFWTGRGAVFTRDSVDALRMARQRDAETVISNLTCLSGCKATEHTWSKA